MGASVTDQATSRRIMVDTQIRPADVTKFPIIAAMLDVPREAFVPTAQMPVAYADAPVPLGAGREMTEPRTLAKMLDALGVDANEDALVVAANLGYSTALLARLAGSVTAVEPDEAMASEAEAALMAHGVDAAVVAGPAEAGLPKAAPFDVILIDGGVEVVPAGLLEQLHEGGRICALFQDRALGEVRIGLRIEGTIAWRFAFNAAAPVLPGFERAHSFAL